MDTNRLALTLGSVMVVVIVVASIVIGSHQSSAPTSTTVVFPPHTMDEARTLSQSSKFSLIVEKGEMLSFPPCRCRLNVVVPSGIGARQTAASLLKVFFDNNLDGQLDDFGQDGGVVVFGYHDAGEIGQSYTAGRIELQLFNGQHTMTIDVGSVLGKDKEYSFTY